MNTKLLTFAAALLLGCSLNAQQLPFENPYAFGLDLSFVIKGNLPPRFAQQQAQVEYKDVDGTVATPWQIFRNHGYNWARLMICNEPSNLGQDLNYVIQGAEQLKAHNYHFALDIMMSDGWSNPMTQPTPSSFKDMTHKQRVQAFYDWTYNVVKTLKDKDLCPEMVQVGNEISNGAFWPDGRVYYGDEKKDQSHWKEFTDYIKSGIKAVRDVDPKIQIMLHEDFGGDVQMSEIFFTKMQEYKVNFDVVGFSFYPWSHGTLMDLRDNLYLVIRKYKKPVYVIETGYYSAPSDYYEKKGEVKAPFPETPEGQMQWFQAVNEIVMAAPDNMGRGVFWWEPMMGTRGFFERDGSVKPIVKAFEKYAMPDARADGNPRIWDFEPGERPAR